MTAPAVPAARSAAVPRTLGILLALLLVAAGLVAAREALAAASLLGLHPSDAWLPGALQELDGRPVDGAAAGAGAVLVVLGLVLLLAAAHRGPADVAVRENPVVRLRPEDVARLATARAADVDGVLSVRSSATARTVQVQVDGTGATGLGDEVRAAVEHRLAGLTPTVQVRVVVHDRGASR